MHKNCQLWAICLAVAGLLSTGWTFADDSRNTSRHVRAPHTGRVAIGGFCPVSITDGDELARGDYRIAARFRGRTYLFPTQRLKAIFAADPVRYVTEVDRKYDHLRNGVNLNGYCPVCVVDGQRLVFGRGFFSSTYEGKTYHFASEFQKRRFDKNPDRYFAYALERYHAILESKGYSGTTTAWPQNVIKGNRPDWAMAKSVSRAGTFKPKMEDPGSHWKQRGFLNDEGSGSSAPEGSGAHSAAPEGSGAHAREGSGKPEGTALRTKTYPSGSMPSSVVAPAQPTAEDIEAARPFNEGSRSFR
jgi:YHS domain-containing protein